MAESEEIQYEPPEGPPPTAARHDLDNPFSDDQALASVDTANDPAQVGPSLLTVSNGVSVGYVLSMCLRRIGHYL
jgi:hypothetical protein